MCEESPASDKLAEVLAGRRSWVWSMPDGELQDRPGATCRGLVPGSFNPLHTGHRRLRAEAEQFLGGAVYYEMALINAEKPPLELSTIHSRRQQFAEHPLALTRAAYFTTKAALFPGTTFVVGVDTAERILDPRFYDGREDWMLAALRRIRDWGCDFLVAGRKQAGAFRTLRDVVFPDEEMAALFAELPAERFRVDLSSTELRRST